MTSGSGHSPLTVPFPPSNQFHSSEISQQNAQFGGSAVVGDRAVTPTNGGAAAEARPPLYSSERKPLPCDGACPATSALAPAQDGSMAAPSAPHSQRATASGANMNASRFSTYGSSSFGQIQPQQPSKAAGNVTLCGSNSNKAGSLLSSSEVVSGGSAGHMAAPKSISNYSSPTSSDPPSPALSSASSTSNETSVSVGMSVMNFNGGAFLGGASAAASASLNPGEVSGGLISGWGGRAMLKAAGQPVEQVQQWRGGSGVSVSEGVDTSQSGLQGFGDYGRMRKFDDGVGSVASSKGAAAAFAANKKLQSGAASAAAGDPSSANSSLSGQFNRANADQLKTFLRKKACLYEVETSRAIVIVTWLVGRALSIKKGHFTRQELQTNIHNIVSPQIESGLVTRTKVNRCMQIILNSCFHYVIPKPDGFDEASARKFAEGFKVTSASDDGLLDELKAPWTNLQERFRVCDVIDGLELSEANDANTAYDVNTVLLCFNANIRSAGDVLYSHNEFIRDIAMSNNLKMTPEDWKFFYSGGDMTVMSSGATDAFQNRGPQQRRNIFHESFIISPDKVGDEECGCMSVSNLEKFRTSWCEKRYTHESKNCAFAHIHMNHGWLRRNPRMYKYTPELCKHVKYDRKLQAFVNSCPEGKSCSFSHSQEEVNYHPHFYKTMVCNGGSAREADLMLENEAKGMLKCRGASMDICPFIHYDGYVGEGGGYGEGEDVQDSHAEGEQGGHGGSGVGVRPFRTTSVGNGSAFSFSLSANKGSHERSECTGEATAKRSLGPMVAPMFYVHPAPTSDFEARLKLPGLISLFRQNSSCLVKWSAGAAA